MPFLMPKLTLMVFNITPNSKGAYILTALSAGWMGAAFSMLLSLKGNLTQTALKDLKVIHKFGYIFSQNLQRPHQCSMKKT